MRSPDGKLFDLAPRPKDEPATLPIAAVASGAAGPAAAAPSLPTPATTGMPPIIAPSAGPPPSPAAPAADSARAQGQPAPTVPAEQPVVVDGGRGRRTPALVGLLLFGGIAVVVLALLAASGFIGGGGPTSPPVIGAGGGGSTVAPPTVPTGSAAGLTSPPPTVPTGSAAGPASVPPNGTPTSSAVIAGGSAPPSAAVGPTGRIVYSSDRQGIVIAAADGSGASVVPGTATTDTDPAWSPDGTNVVFGSAGGIRISPVDVARGVEFSDGGRDDVAPCWSSQGEIAFASRRDGRYQIYVGPADRSAPPQRFRANANTEADPAWSPDGLLLAFVSDRGGDDEIDVVKRDGSGFRQLTSNDARDVDPAWSPDGNLIVFASDLDHAGDYDLWTMKSDGTGLTVLTSGPEIDHDPTWSPDGRFIAFSRSSAGQRGADIVILDLATRSLRLLTNREGSSKFPFWH
jgi:dipeptidyl aminopeptidase/acylaminoacyl peptidase